MAVYTNFTDAFSEWSGALSMVKTQMSGFEVDLTAILTAPNWQTLRSKTWACFVHLRNAFIAHVSPGGLPTDWTGSSHYTSVYYAWDEAEAEEFTMDVLLSTMLGAKFEELQKFIGIEDAYRSALWDEWFNIEFYSALARGFKR